MTTTSPSPHAPENSRSREKSHLVVTSPRDIEEKKSPLISVSTSPRSLVHVAESKMITVENKLSLPMLTSLPDPLEIINEKKNPSSTARRPLIFLHDPSEIIYEKRILSSTTRHPLIFRPDDEDIYERRSSAVDVRDEKKSSNNSPAKIEQNIKIDQLSPATSSPPTPHVKLNHFSPSSSTRPPPRISFPSTSSRSMSSTRPTPKILFERFPPSTTSRPIPRKLFERLPPSTTPRPMPRISSEQLPSSTSTPFLPSSNIHSEREPQHSSLKIYSGDVKTTVRPKQIKDTRAPSKSDEGDNKRKGGRPAYDESCDFLCKYGEGGDGGFILK